MKKINIIKPFSKLTDADCGKIATIITGGGIFDEVSSITRGTGINRIEIFLENNTQKIDIVEDRIEWAFIDGDKYELMPINNYLQFFEFLIENKFLEVVEVDEIQFKLENEALMKLANHSDIDTTSKYLNQ